MSNNVSNSENDYQKSPNNIDNLVNKMKLQDEKFSNLYKRMSVLYFVFVVIYTGLLVVNPAKEILISTRISGLCYVISFLIAGYYFRRYYIELNSLIYTKPLLEVLKDAVNRYKLFNSRQIPMIYVVILIDIGVTISFVFRNEYQSFSKIQLIIIIQVIYFTTMALSAFIGYLWWRKKSKPIHDESLRMIKDLESC